MGRATSINAGFSIFRKVKLFESVLVFAFLEIKNKGMRDKKKREKRMGNEIVEGIFQTKQTKHENLGSETFRVLNKIMHCINYSNVF